MSCWRLRRVQRFEVGAIREQLDECNRPLQSDEVEETEDELEQANRWLAREENILASAEGEQDPTQADPWEFFHLALDNLGEECGFDLTAPQSQPHLREAYLAKLADQGFDRKRLWQKLLAIQHGRVEHWRVHIEDVEAKLGQLRRYAKLEQERAALLGSLPDEENLNKLIRYESMVNRELDRAMNQLERLQRARLGEHIPPPVTLDVNVSEVNKEAG